MRPGLDTRVALKAMNISDHIRNTSAFRPSRRVAAFGAATVVVALLIQALPASIAGRLNAEDGPFEVGSAVLLGVAVLVGLAGLLRRPTTPRLGGAVVLAALLCRELDFQKRFTYRSIESVGFYTRPIASWTEKAVGITILLALGLAALVVARAAVRRLPAAVRMGESWMGSLATAAGLVVTSLVCEKFLGFTVAEEVLETGFAAMVVCIAWQTATLAPVAIPQVQAAPAIEPLVPMGAAHASQDAAREESRRLAA